MPRRDSNNVAMAAAAAASNNSDILTIDMLVHQDDWVSDSERYRCHVCTRNFTSFRRKHHCRKCGEVVCSNCTLSKEAELPVVGRSKIRVCMSCILSHANPEPTPASTSAPPAPNSPETVERNRDWAAQHMHSPTGNSEGDISQFSRDFYQPDFEYPLDFNWDHPWPKPPVVPGENERLEALRHFEILDTPPEDVFDIICDLASNALKCPIAAVSLIDEDRQWFKASVGLAQNEIPRNVSFCAHTIMSKEPLVVMDTKLDRRFEKNPLVTGSANIRFYAGAPICTQAGYVLGTVFVFDTEARSTCDIATLEKLSNVAMKNLEDRKSALAGEDSNGQGAGASKPGVSTSAGERTAGGEARVNNSKQVKNAANVNAAANEARDMVNRPIDAPSDTQDLIAQNSQAGEGQIARGPQMETMLMDLLCRTTETQQQLATQQGAMFHTLGQHTQDIDRLASAMARMEAKLDSLTE